MWTEITKSGKYKFCEKTTLPDGRTIKKCVTYSKNTKSIQKEAQIELLKRIEEEKLKKPTLETITIKTLVDMYMQEAHATLKHSSIKIKEYVFRDLIQYCGDSKLINLDIVYLNKYCSNISPQYLVHIKGIFNWAYKRGYIENKISDRLYTHYIEKKRDIKLFFEKNEIPDLLQELEKNSKSFNQKELRLLVEFLILTGLRIGEALALTTEDIANNELTVSKTFYKGVINSPKTETSYRTIAINSRAIQIVKEMEFLKRINGIESNIIFPNKKGDHNESSTLSVPLKKIANAGFHSFRRTHATLLAEEGVKDTQIQRRLGHEKDDITKKLYIQITERKKNEEKELFKNLDIL